MAITLPILFAVLLFMGKVTEIIDSLREELDGVPVPWRQVAVATFLILTTVLLLTFAIPLRIAFATAQPQFERMLAEVKRLPRNFQPADRHAGLYEVDRVSIDPRGGVYFRVNRGTDGIGPDTMSYGFAFEPNPDGSPFGAAGYNLRRMGGSWYAFSASNDWH
jgi:hypothetical protein